MILEFTGTTKWAKGLKEIDEYKGVGRWKCQLYLTDESFKKLKTTGVPLKVREDDDGKYVVFKRPQQIKVKDDIIELEPPRVFDSDGKPFDDNIFIGNGSTLTVKVMIYDTPLGKAHRLEKVRVDNLIEYVPSTFPENDDEF